MNSKIKWIKNGRVKRNPKIDPSNIVEENYRPKRDEIIVTMINSSKESPIINIKFPCETETVERKEKNSVGKWITKSWVTKHKVMASINVEENYIHFNRTRFKPSELKFVTEVIDYVSEIILKKFVGTNPPDSFSPKEINLKNLLTKLKIMVY